VALVTALKDQDPRTVRLALGLIVALHSCPAAAVSLLVSRASDRVIAADLRVLAIRALGATTAPAALEALLRLTTAGRTLFGKERLPPKSPELLVALAALVTGWAHDPRTRAAQAGIQRLEFEDRVGREDFEAFLAEVLARLTLSAIDTSEARQLRRSSIRYGTVGVRGETEQGAEVPTATIRYSLGEEADTVRWFQDEVKTRGVLPLTEAEAVVSSLSLAMHGSRHILIPLLQLKEFDQYTTTHSMNVAVLAMALAEFL